MIRDNRFFVLRAWMVHFYTALGLPTAAAAFYFLMNGDAKNMFAMIGLAMFIDATDGTLARAWNVKKWTPDFDGRKLDDITDFLTYAFIPLFYMAVSGRVPLPWGLPVLALVLLVAAYGFCRGAAKTDDGYFTGFPNFWNLAVFYLYIFDPAPLVNLFILVFLAANMWVPIKYMSFSTRPYRRLSVLLTLAFAVALVMIGIQLESPNMLLVYLSLLFPIYYTGMSIYLTLRKPGEM